MSLTGGERVTFASQGETAVAVLGPVTFQKEQAPTLYAQPLSQLGYATLIFDTRSRGESSGEPRCYENPASKGPEKFQVVVDALNASS
jgi:hypothetical protein